MERRYDQFAQLSTTFTQQKYLSLSQSLQSIQNKVSKQMDMPSYYKDALVAIELFNQGFFQPAKVIALSVISQNADYLLPYQILAYANVLTNSWEAALSYLATLSDKDSSSAEKYAFLMGIAYYREGNYEKSVLKLSQVKEPSYRLDAERYLALDYQALGQTNKLLTSREKILGYTSLQKSDFYNYFYQVFRLPYTRGETFTLYQKNPTLAKQYLTLCSKFFPDESLLCTYGSVGMQLANQIPTGLVVQLLPLIEQYPQGALYHAIGEAYLNEGNPLSARPYLLKAAGMVTDPREATILKQLLAETIPASQGNSIQ